MKRAFGFTLPFLLLVGACEDYETTSPTGAGAGTTTTVTGGGGTGGTPTTGGGGTGAQGGSGGQGGSGAQGGSGGQGGSGAQGGQGGSGQGGSGAQGSTGGATNLSATITGGDVSLTWTPPGSASGYPGVRLLRRLNADPTAADDPEAVLVYEGSAAEALDDLEGLLPDRPEDPRDYHYGVFGCDGATCDPAGSFAAVTPTLLDALRGGGYVVFWRHAAATVCSDNLALGTAENPQIPDWWKSCDETCPPAGMATARQLDAFGKMQAPMIGTSLLALGVPFGQVVSSEYCRCKGTAELMDLGPTIETSPALTYWVHDEQNRCALSYDMLETKPAPDTNTALVSHAGFLCPVLDALAWGEAAIFKPDGTGGTTFITTVVWDAWDALP